MSQTLDFDIELFKSAFADLQIELMTGNGGQGLRSFFQELTEDVNYFKNSLKDGFDIGDIGGVVARVVTQLKNKFLEFDGIGSILAGGALAMGLKKIYNLTMQVKNAAMAMKTWYSGTATTPPPMTSGGKNGAITQSVGSMVVHANSVVVNGKAVTQGAGTATAGRNSTTVTTGGTSASKYHDNFHDKNEPTRKYCQSRWRNRTFCGGVCGYGYLRHTFNKLRPNEYGAIRV